MLNHQGCPKSNFFLKCQIQLRGYGQGIWYEMEWNGNSGMEDARMEWNGRFQEWNGKNLSYLHTNSILDFVHDIYRKTHPDVG